jgi:hypothetical protein
MRVAMALLLATLAFLAAPSSAQQVSSVGRDCRDDRGADRCDPKGQAAVRAKFGIDPVEAYVDRKAALLRAVYIDGYGNPVGVVDVTRNPGEEPRLSVRILRPDGFTSRVAEMTAVVPLATWEDLLRRSATFDRDFVPLPGPARDEIEFCLHGWMATVEAVSPSGKIRRKTQSACGGEGAVVALSFDFARAALALLPACALLDPDQHRNDVTRLAVCATLEGDRAAAALARNVYGSTWFANPHGPDMAFSLRHLFFDHARIDWAGEPPADGAAAAALLWTTKMPSRHLFVQRLIGETADRVRIEGMIDEAGAAPDQRRVAPVTQIWTRENGFGFRLSAMTVGKSFSPPLPKP